MDHIPTILLIAGSVTGVLLASLLAWQLVAAIGRLVMAVHTSATIDLLLARLAAATRATQPWDPVLRGLRLEMPWPWPWRLGRAAERIAAGQDAAAVLETSSLLPLQLRVQAAQALRQGPDAFTTWCDAIIGRTSQHPLAARQYALLLAECVAMTALIHFLIVFIMPKFEQIFRDIGVPTTALFAVTRWLSDWWSALLLAVSVGITVVWSATLAQRWRTRRRQAAARLLLAGSAARLPEAALGDGDGFAGLCHAAGWDATTPVELARALARDEDREAMRAAWLPSLLATCTPLAAAVPVAAMAIGIMHMLITLLTQAEALS